MENSMTEGEGGINDRQTVQAGATLTPYWTSPDGRHVIYCADALAVLATLPDCSVQCCVTSPPYWGLRDYGVAGQLGLESTPAEYVEKMVAVFREVRRVLSDRGTLWLNLGDSYAGSGKGRMGDGSHSLNGGDKQHTNRGSTEGVIPKYDDGLKPKDLVGIPWRVAFALQADGWYLRQDIIWSKPNPMPESVTDRCTKSHEYLFLLAKSARYYFNADAIAERASVSPHAAGYVSGEEYAVGTRNKRSVWTVTTQPYKEAHFATFPPKLIEPCILAGCPAGGVVLDCFSGSGTTGLVALQHGRRYVGIELSREYCDIAVKRMERELSQPMLPFEPEPESGSRLI
jgi:DNA modification methylase